MSPQALTWINAEFVEKVLRHSENDDSIRVKDLSMQFATAIGDNYLSDMIRANVKYSRNNSVGNASEKKSVIIKAAPTTGTVKDLVSNLGVFDTEIQMMENTLVKMNEMLKDEGYRLSARVLFARVTDPSLIVIEDLAPLGYRMANRLAGLDLEHCIFAMRGLARFHATSVALLEKDPNAMAKYNRNVLGENTHKGFPQPFKIVANEVLDWTELGSSRHSYSEKILKLSDNFKEKFIACTTPKADEFNVLNHGDCWVNNMLFRYNDEGKVTDHIFVDFQLCILSSPALDILAFTNTSLLEDVACHYRDALLEEYLTVLTKTMTRLGCNTKAPDMAGLKKLLEKYQFLAIMATCIYSPFILVEKSEAKSINEMKKEGENFIHPGYKSRIFRNRLVRLLPSWDASGALDN